jgi:dCTP deaminase
MILSNVSIQKALDNSWLIIDPEPFPRTPTSTDAKCPYDTSALDLRLGNEIVWFKEECGFLVDLTRDDFRSLLTDNSETAITTKTRPYVLHPHKMVLGQTMERISLPIAKDRICLAARVEGKSSYARSGLLVHFTAPTIHANFSGTITLELINLGPLPILLYPEMYICQLIIEQVDGIPFGNDSQFQNQNTAGGRKK